ncbi:Uncharacterized protein Fot_34672 [Forsythia ovata]|uniref:DEAD-box RNA helicase Q domain-containing protein n=1 Tax=Forsythia ovata TaxID=205694 RepID=A0ABD1SJC5_9LAMI
MGGHGKGKRIRVVRLGREKNAQSERERGTHRSFNEWSGKRGVSFHANSFLELHLSRPLLRACEALGYSKPTPIQYSPTALDIARKDRDTYFIRIQKLKFIFCMVLSAFDEAKCGKFGNYFPEKNANIIIGSSIGRTVGKISLFLEENYDWIILKRRML